MHQHIQKGNEDGLFISCVASSENLWAVVMDAGTGFANQVIKLSQKFLDKVCYGLPVFSLYFDESGILTLSCC
jgi:hypothetical protein